MVSSYPASTHATERADFEAKLANFLTDHALSEEPVLVLQSAPESRAWVDVGSAKLFSALLNGSGVTRPNDWWNGFAGHKAPVKTFEGLAAGGRARDQGWMTEVHEDGNIIAAIVLGMFPNQHGSGAKVVDKGALELFPSFFELLKKLDEVSTVQVPMRLTATLVNASKIALSTRTFAPSVAQRRAALEWPVLLAPNLDEVSAVCAKMRARLERAYS